MKKKNKAASFLVVLLILALLAGGAYYYFAADKKETNTKEETKKDTKKKEEKTEEETITITFDVDGGKEVKEITVKVDEEVELPTTTKDGYTFKGWYLDDKKVDTKTSFKEDTTLKAKWEKKEEKKEEPKKEEKKVTYSCPDGYKLDGTKCTISTAAKTKCPDKAYEYNGKCVTLTDAARKDSKKTCGTKIINTGGGHTPSVQGEIFKMGTYYCYYGKVTDSYENNQSNCTSRGHKWNSENSTCYYDRDDANVNITSTCDHLSGYVYLSNPNTYQGVNGLNGGCFPVTDKTSYCDTEGYTLSGSNCVKTIEATKN